MLKRICALALILSVMMVAAPVMSVSAAYTSRWTDNFEEETAGAVASTSGGDYYASAKTGEENGLFIQPTANSNSKHLTVAAEMGYNGSTGLYLHADTNMHSTGACGYRTANIMTRGVTLTDNSAVILRYKVKFPEPLPTSSTTLGYLSAISTLTQGPGYGRTPYPFTTSDVGSGGTFATGEWYTVVTRVTGAGTAKSSSFYILDDDGTMKVQKTQDITVSAADSPMYFWPAYIVGNVSTEPVRLVVDDVSLTEYTAANEAISLDAAAGSIQTGAVGVGIGDSFMLAFDQTLADGACDTVTLYKKADESKTPIAVTISNKAFDSFSVTPAENLELATEYVLDFSGVTNSAGLALSGQSTIEFTTFDPGETPGEPVRFVEADITEGATGIGLSQSITVQFDQELIEPAMDTAVKLYKTADAAQTAVPATLALTADKKGFTVTPQSNLSLDTGYTLDFSGVQSTLYAALAEDTTKSLTFTTIASREAIFAEDTLEGVADGTSGSQYASEVLATGSYTIGADCGFEASGGVQVTSTNISTKTFELDDKETAFFECKIKIGEVTGSGAYMCINGAAFSRALLRISPDSEGQYYIGDQGGAKTYYYTPNTWYTMVWKVTNQAQKGYLLDASGKVVFEADRNIDAQYMTGTVTFSPLVRITGSTYEIAMDDCKVYRVQADALALDSDRSSVYSGSAGFMPGRSITLAFNQPLSVNSAEAEGAAKLYCGSTEVAATVSRIGGNEIRIVPTEKLEDGTEYTIKLSGLAALSGNTSAVPAEFTFTTRETYPVKVTGTSLAISGGSVSAGEYTVSFQNSGNDAVSGVLVAAFYTDNRLSELKSLAILGTQSLGSGASTVTVSLSGGYENVGRVELLLYDSLTNLTPLMHAHRVYEQ